MESLPFAQRLAAAKSIQGIVRALGLLAAEHPGVSELRVQWLGDNGASVSFGAPNPTAHDRFLQLMEATESLMALEAKIEFARELNLPSAVIDGLIARAEVEIKKVYPSVSTVRVPESK